MPLDTQFVTSLAATQSSTPLDMSVSPVAALAYTKTISLTTGTGLNQADQIFFDQRTIAISGTDDLDLAGGVTHSITGAAFSFARIKGILIYAAIANTNNVIVGGAAATQFATWVGAAAHTVTVRPGGMFMLFAPDATAYAVTAATADLLRIANSGAVSTVLYDIILIGASA